MQWYDNETILVSDMSGSARLVSVDPSQQPLELGPGRLLDG